MVLQTVGKTAMRWVELMVDLLAAWKVVKKAGWRAVRRVGLKAVNLVAVKVVP